MSRLTRSIFALALSFSLVAGSARASQVVFGNLGSDGSGSLSTVNDNILADNYVAQGFSTGASSTLLYLDEITLGLAATDGGTFSTTISIWSSLGGSPDTLLQTSSSQNVTGSTSAKYSFGFGGLALTANTSYWVVMQQVGVSWYFVPVAAGAPSEKNSSGYSGLGQVASADGGSSWESAGNSRYSFSATASATGPEPIPEPGTWAAAALLIGAAAYVRWRRRPQAV